MRRAGELCLTWCSVLLFRCCLWILIWVCWIVLLVVRKVCVRVNSIVWDTEGRYVCSIKFTQREPPPPPTHKYLHKCATTRNTRALFALSELALVITRCRTDQFTRLFLPAAAVRL